MSIKECNPEKTGSQEANESIIKAFASFEGAIIAQTTTLETPAETPPIVGIPGFKLNILAADF